MNQPRARQDPLLPACPRGYRIEYHPQLIEEAVLWVVSGHPHERLFRRERDEIYEREDEEAREEAFVGLHERWFERLGLSAPLQEVLSRWPILTSSTDRCLLLKARAKTDAGAELYVGPNASAADSAEQRVIIIQLLPEAFARRQQLRAFLGRELLHIVDMVTPEFGYEPHVADSGGGPAYERVIRERYRILWDITIDGRLVRSGWLPSSVRKRHRKIFENTFPGPAKETEKIFSSFFDKWPCTHQQLLGLARLQPGRRSPRRDLSQGQCTLCRFSSFDLIADPAANIQPRLLDKIKNDQPSWDPSQNICRQCLDLYAFGLGPTRTGGNVV